MTRPASWASPLAEPIQQFLAYKRALARRFEVEEKALRLLDRYLVVTGVRTLAHITAEVLEAFLASRPRTTPRSYNHLLGTVARLFNWLVTQGILERSPLRAKPRRRSASRVPFLFDQPRARQLLELAGALPDNPRAPLRGLSYRTIFALLYGLGLRVGEVSRLCIRDIDFDRELLVIQRTKFAKDRLVPFGPRLTGVLRAYLDERQERFGPLPADAPAFSFVAGRSVNPNTISMTFRSLVRGLGLQLAPGASPPRAHDLRHNAECRIMPIGPWEFGSGSPLVADDAA
ncbi:MAG: tyrosine-type recombinase/integrase [Chloroflexi bacterium]|nr:tyrosine-type recombinase/integrase [Chloroflexota bacterium]